MQEQHIETFTLGNGLTLIIEPMTSVQSASFALLVPSGSIYDPPGQNGSASLLCEQIFRGAGERDSRELAASLDNLGVQYTSRVGTTHLTFGGATLAENLPDALRIFSDVILRPHLPEDQFEAARASVAQGLRAIEDEPRQKIFVELKKRCYDFPYGSPSEGTLEDLFRLTPQSPREHFHRCFRPNDTILAVAGNVSVPQVKHLVEQLFGEWELKTAPEIEITPRLSPIDHLHHDSEQTQIGIAWESVPYRHADYYTAWAAVSILSGGMSSRLFTEVREKRGLCYSVYASLNSLRDEARVLCYAGTTVERAQETLDVTLQEVNRLGDGIEENELARCKARAKSSLIMQQESTAQRAGALARNWYYMGRVLSLQEIYDMIDRLTVDHLLVFLHEYPARNFSIVTIGPQALEIPDAVS